MGQTKQPRTWETHTHKHTHKADPLAFKQTNTWFCVWSGNVCGKLFGEERAGRIIIVCPSCRRTQRRACAIIMRLNDGDVKGQRPERGGRLQKGLSFNTVRSYQESYAQVATTS